LSANLGVVGDVYRLLGDPQRATRVYQEGMQIGTSQWDVLGIQYRLGMALLEQGEDKAGMRLAESAYEKARQMDLGIVYIPAMSTLALMLVRTGRIEEAVERAQQWQAGFADRFFSTPEMMGGGIGILAQASLQLANRAELERLALTGIQTLRRSGNPFWELQGYRLLRLAGPLNETAWRRVQELLETIDRRVRHPDLRDLTENFLRHMRAELFEQ
jgi:hypothetical protein